MSADKIVEFRTSIAETDLCIKRNHRLSVKSSESWQEDMIFELDGELISYKFSVAKDLISKNCIYLKKLELLTSLPVTKPETIRLCVRMKELINSLQDHGKKCKCQLRALLLREWGVWRWTKFFSNDERLRNGVSLFFKELAVVGKLFWNQKQLQILDLTGFGATAGLGTYIIEWAATHCGRSLTTIELMDYFIPELIYPKETSYLTAISLLTNINHFGINNYALYPQSKILETIANKNKEKLQTLAIQCRGWDPPESLCMDGAVWTNVCSLCPDLKLHLCLKNIGLKKAILDLLPENLPLCNLVFWLKFDSSNEADYVKSQAIISYRERHYNWLLSYIYIRFRTTIECINIHLTDDVEALDKDILTMVIKECQCLKQVEIEASISLDVLDALCLTVSSLQRRIQKFHVIILNILTEEQAKLQNEYYKYQVILACIKDWSIIANDNTNKSNRVQ